MIKLPLVGPAYKMQSQSISCQNCINWYPQTIECPNGSRVAALMPTPGLKKIFNDEVAAIRCLYVLSNGALLAVIGKRLYHSKANKFDLQPILSEIYISALGTVRIADNGQVALIVNGTYTYALDLKKLTLTRLSGSTIPRSTHVLFLDGRFVVNKANTGQFYWSDLYSTTVNALSYATAESTPDNITAIVTFNRELWLFGAQSVERYYGTGSSNSPFSRLSGGAMAFGCLAPDSIVSLATGVIWLGVSEFGGNQIVMSSGGIPDRISTHALEEGISSFSKTSDASAYAYQIEGHVFYVISFPSANVTYCFDVSTGLWHQRSFTNPQGLHERHRSQHHAYFNNMHIVGDYRNGKLYQLDNNTFTDDGELILRERTAQAVITDKKMTRFSKLEIVCETGFGTEVIKNIPNPEPVGCEGSISTCTIGTLTNGGYYKIFVNDVEILESNRLFRGEDWARSLSKILKDEFNVVLLPLRLDLSVSTDPFFNDVENGRFENRNNSYVKIRIVTIDASAINQQFEPLNGSMQLTPRPEEGASFCLSPYNPPMISCVDATNSADTGGIWGDVTITINGTIYDALLPIDGLLQVDNHGSELHNTFKNLSNQNLRVRITSTQLYSSDYGWGENTNPTLTVDFGTNNGVIEFCLAPNINTCVALPPVNLNLEKTLYKLDKSKDYFIYIKDSNNVVHGIEIYSSMELGNNIKVFSIQDFPRFNGFIIDCISETELYPETCNTLAYEGTYYVKQRVQTWYDHHYIGSFYVDINGVRTYLQNSSKNFPHNGASLTLKEVLEPYYKDVAAFLVSFGVDAVYVPDLWGSYNSGGVKVIRTPNQYETIKFGSDTGYDLMFDGYSDSTCISFKTFEELENGPSSLSIKPIMEGNPGKNEITLLGTHIPPDENSVNILQVLGLNRNFNISSCFEDMPS